MIDVYGDWRRENALQKFRQPVDPENRMTWDTGESNPVNDSGNWYWDPEANEGAGAWVYTGDVTSDQQGPPLSPGSASGGTDSRYYPPGPYDPENQDSGNGTGGGEEGPPPEGGWPWDIGNLSAGLTPAQAQRRSSPRAPAHAQAPSASPFYQALSAQPTIPVLAPARMSPVGTFRGR